jgi:hypothetical protein
MRPDKELRAVVDAALGTCGGSFAIVVLAQSTEESKVLWDMLKGRRGNKSVTIRIAKPEDFIPIMDRARAASPAPAAEPEELDYDGY